MTSQITLHIVEIAEQQMSAWGYSSEYGIVFAECAVLGNNPAAVKAHLNANGLKATATAFNTVKAVQQAIIRYDNNFKFRNC